MQRFLIDRDSSPRKQHSLSNPQLPACEMVRTSVSIHQSHFHILGMYLPNPEKLLIRLPINYNSNCNLLPSHMSCPTLLFLTDNREHYLPTNMEIKPRDLGLILFVFLLYLHLFTLQHMNICKKSASSSVFLSKRSLPEDSFIFVRAL